MLRSFAKEVKELKEGVSKLKNPARVGGVSNYVIH
jgi:hypothetical protein